MNRRQRLLRRALARRPRRFRFRITWPDGTVHDYVPRSMTLNGRPIRGVWSFTVRVHDGIRGGQ